MKGLSILGCTGSVGTNVLRIVEAFPGRFSVVGLAAGRNVERLAEQAARHRPRVVSVATAEARDALQRLVIVDACQARAVLDDPGVRIVQQLQAMEREARQTRTAYLLASLAASRATAAASASATRHRLDPDRTRTLPRCQRSWRAAGRPGSRLPRLD